MTPLEISAPPRPFCNAPRRVRRRAPGARLAVPCTTRTVPEETAIAFSYEGAAYAVMMATPADLTDFAVGFSLAERVIGSPHDVETLETVSTADGIMVRMSLAHQPAAAYWERRRRLAGPSGCGLCGLESLADAMRSPPTVAGGARISHEEIFDAMAALPEWQPMNRATGALHAAALWLPGRGIVMAREDVGRHNALDKLIGAAARDGISASGGAVLLTSRVSVEMVQKAAILGAPVLVAVSAPTALAVRVAQTAGITLAAIARQDGFEIFTRADRLLDVEFEQLAAAD
jgi:FdhD protein